MSPAPTEARPYIWPATEGYEVWAAFPSRLLASCTSLASALAARRLLQGTDGPGPPPGGPLPGTGTQEAEGEGAGSAR